MYKYTMKHPINIRACKGFFYLFLIFLSLCFFCTGCFAGGDVHDVTPNIPSPTPTQEGNALTAKQRDAYEQMTLFIQEGFRTYGIEGNYRAYFGEIITPVTSNEKRMYDGDTPYSCAILLEEIAKDVEERFWEEQLSFSYDADQDRYTFKGDWEPVLVGDYSWAERSESDFVTQMCENYVYKTEISQEKQFTIPVRYQGANGPVDHHEFWLDGDNRRDTDKYIVRPYIYSYLDDRLEFYATIGYPEIFCEDKELEETINSIIQKELIGQIGKDDMYGEMTSRYKIERADDMYFSIDCTEYYNTQWGAHPAEWPATLTINMETGAVVTLEDIVGEKWNLQTLLASDAFVWDLSWAQEPPSPEEWKEEVQKRAENETLSDYDDWFYLTEDSLCLYTYFSYFDGYCSIEAKLSDLGLE